VDVEHIFTRKTCFVHRIRAHSQYADGAAIRRIVSVEDDRLATDVRSASSGMNTIDRRVLPRIFIWDSSNYLVMAFFPQLLLWHLH
jgi:hypothetical protein